MRLKSRLPFGFSQFALKDSPLFCVTPFSKLGRVKLLPWVSNLLFMALLLGLFSTSLAGKQTVVLRLKQPLRAETVKVRIPGVVNQRGERRDVEALLKLGPVIASPKLNGGPKAEEVLTLGLDAKSLGRSGMLVSFTLPNSANVEIAVLDFYGKTLGTVVTGQYPKGKYILPPYPYRESDKNGVRFLALKIDGRIVLRKMLSKVN